MLKNKDINKDIKERGLPLPFERVQALQRGVTQFRFPVKPQYGGMNHGGFIMESTDRTRRRGDAIFYSGDDIVLAPSYAYARCPYGKPGDRLFVKEPWGTGTRPDPFEGWRDGIEYKADEVYLDEHDLLPLYSECVPDNVCLDDYYKAGWRSSIHMPRWASRYLLEVVSVRVERVQDIEGVNLAKEGVIERDFREIENFKPYSYDGKNWHGSGRFAFAEFWDFMNKKKFGWEVNPWVWVVEYRSIEG